jgi:hypothetical protein
MTVRTLPHPGWFGFARTQAMLESTRTPPFEAKTRRKVGSRGLWTHVAYLGQSRHFLKAATRPTASRPQASYWSASRSTRRAPPGASDPPRSDQHLGKGATGERILRWRLLRRPIEER